MPLPHRIETLLRLALRVFVLAAVAFLSAIITIGLAIRGSEVAVPDISKMKAPDAAARLGGLGLQMKIEDRVFSDLPAEAVVRQSPRAGENVKRTQRVHVLLSLGPQKITVPAVVNKSLRSARIELLQAGLQVGNVSSVHSLGIENDTVAEQNPGSQNATARSPRVNLLVSLGEPEKAYVMPELLGLTLGEAHRRLTASGLVLGQITTVVVAGQAQGGVVQQWPVHGMRVTPSSKVELQVGE